jgi:hypothetical protein
MEEAESNNLGLPYGADVVITWVSHYLFCSIVFFIHLVDLHDDINSNIHMAACKK